MHARWITLGLALATTACMTGCYGAKLKSVRKQSAFLVRNETSHPLEVRYEQDRAPEGTSPYHTTCSILPGDEVRFTGRPGDRLSVGRDGSSAHGLVFARPSRVLSAGEDPDGSLTLTVRRGFR